MAAVPRIDIRPQLVADWKSVVDGAATVTGLDVAAFTKALPLPSLPELAKLNTAVNTVVGLLEGAPTPDQLKAAGHMIGDAIGDALKASLATVGIAAGPIGFAAGLIVGEAISVAVDAFTDDTLARRAIRAAARAATDKVQADIIAWENSARRHAWELLAGLSGDLALIGTFETKGWSGLTPTDSRKIAAYDAKSIAILRRWGFQPEAPPLSPPWSTWGFNGSWEWISWKVLDTYGNADENVSAAADLRVDLMKRRLAIEAQAVQLFETYAAALRGIQEAAIKTAEKGGVRVTLGGSTTVLHPAILRGFFIHREIPPLVAPPPPGGYGPSPELLALGRPQKKKKKSSAIPWVIGGLVLVGAGSAGYVYKRALARWWRSAVRSARRR